jgi:hypothetical protein
LLEAKRKSVGMESKEAVNAEIPVAVVIHA